MAEDVIPVEFIALLKAYLHSKLTIRMLDKETKLFDVESGVKQRFIVFLVMFK